MMRCISIHRSFMTVQYKKNNIEDNSYVEPIQLRNPQPFKAKTSAFTVPTESSDSEDGGDQRDPSKDTTPWLSESGSLKSRKSVMDLFSPCDPRPQVYTVPSESSYSFRGSSATMRSHTVPVARSVAATVISEVGTVDSITHLSFGNRKRYLNPLNQSTASVFSVPPETDDEDEDDVKSIATDPSPTPEPSLHQVSAHPAGTQLLTGLSIIAPSPRGENRK
eukprot:UN24716